MRLKRLEIRNYKSLRDVAIEPTPLSVFVGPNGAGKTNLADALDFLGHAYRWDLESAVSQKGGYENICYRDSYRSKDPISFKILVESKLSRIQLKGLGLRRSYKEDTNNFAFEHALSFKANSRSIQSPFAITSETVSVYSADVPPKELLQISRAGNGLISEVPWLKEVEIPVNTLLLSFLKISGMRINKMRVFQLSPSNCREASSPSPNAELDHFGRNLPSTIAYLKRESSQEFFELVDTLRRITPSIENIETSLIHGNMLALFVKEKGVSRPWTSDQISDGTIQTIALLTAVFDPRSSLVVIEEPENSVHPWALRNLVEAFRVASEKKQILLTTHSPILIDQLKPEEIWVVRKPGTETKIDPLLSLDPSLKEAWGQGKFTLSEYLDSGAVPEAVPAAGL